MDYPNYEKLLPCPRCYALAQKRRLRAENIMPLPDKCPPRSRDVTNIPCCYDCAAADYLMLSVGTFEMARIAVGTAREENLRLPPGIREAFGLVGIGHVRNIGDDPNALEHHQQWLSKVIPNWQEL